MYENIEPEIDPIEEFKLLKDSHSEYAMIWRTLYKASTKALECNNAITNFFKMCDEVQFLQNQYRQ